MKFLKLYEDYRILEEVPKYFYLVLNIKRSWESLINKEFIGLKGISDNPNIINGFFDIRDTLLVMDGQKVLDLNPNMFKIDYDNPHQLVANNFYIINRIKQNDSRRYHDVFKTIFDTYSYDYKKDSEHREKYPDLYKTVQYLKRKDYSLGELFEQEEKDKNIMINNVNDFVNWLYHEGIPKMKIETSTNVPYGTEPYDPKKITKKLLYFIIQEGLKNSTKYWKANEGEWLIKKDKIKQERVFKIPEESKIYFKLGVDWDDEEDAKRYKNKYTTAGLDSDSHWGGEGMELIQGLIDNHDLEKKYDVRWAKGYMKAHDIYKDFGIPKTKTTYKPMRNPYFKKPGRKKNI